MVRRHEIPQSASGPDLHEEALRKTREESGIFNGTQLDFFDSESGVDPERPQYRKPHRSASRKRRAPEPRYGDSEIDAGPPQYQQPYTPQTPEEIAANKAVLEGPGHQAAVAVGILATHNAIMKATEGESVTYRLARERAAQELRDRRLHG